MTERKRTKEGTLANKIVGAILDDRGLYDKEIYLALSDGKFLRIDIDEIKNSLEVREIGSEEYAILVEDHQHDSRVLYGIKQR